MLPGSFLGAACGGLRARASAAPSRGRRLKAAFPSRLSRCVRSVDESARFSRSQTPTSPPASIGTTCSFARVTHVAVNFGFHSAIMTSAMQ